MTRRNPREWPHASDGATAFQSRPAQLDRSEANLLRRLLSEALADAVEKLSQVLRTRQPRLHPEPGDDPARRSYMERLLSDPGIAPERLVDSPESVSWRTVRTLIKAADMLIVDVLVSPEENASLSEDERQAVSRRRLHILNEWCQKSLPRQRV